MMKHTKICLRILPALLALLLLLTACEEFNPAAERPGQRPVVSGAESDTEPAVTDSQGNIDENPFTVTLTYGGKVFTPSADQPLEVQWNNGYSLHTAPLGADGVARIGGLDGDYRVTLTTVPNGYAYNANIYTATNDRRAVEIELYRLIETKGPGDQEYNSIRIQSTGVYCVELKNPKHKVFYEFAPRVSGTYSVESWMDTTANEINPMAEYWGASVAYKWHQFTQDDGGISSTYTKNFKLDVQIADENISENGSAAFTFAMKAANKKWEGLDAKECPPIKIYFAITLDGEFSLDHVQSTLMVPQVELTQQPNYDESYTFVGAETVKTVGSNTANVFDSDSYKLWPKSEGGDDYYHVYDEVKYPMTGGYGPILYAKISQPTRFMAEPFNQLEYQGNKALTLSNGAENYKLFIEGYDALNSYTLSASNPNGKPPYFCILECPCRTERTNDSVAITGEVGCCITGCETCHPSCNNAPAEAIGTKGYANYTNSDGCYGVTAELKDFLQKYCISQLLFMDGNGLVETHESIRVYAAEEDQWLFACGYYVKK